MTMIFNARYNAASDLLKELGSLEPNGIAAMLDTEGIKGTARGCRTCPIAEFLKKRLDQQFFVTLSYAYFFDGEAEDINDDNAVPVPGSVRKFIKNFDAGKYLFLDTGRPIE